VHRYRHRRVGLLNDDIYEANRSDLVDGQGGSGIDLVLKKIFPNTGLAMGDLFYDEHLIHLTFDKWCMRWVEREREFTVRNRIAVWIDLWVTEVLCEMISKPITEIMFETVGLLVNISPRNTEMLGEKRLN